MPNDEINSAWARNWQRAKRTAVEYLAVFISTIGFIFGVLGLMVGMVAAWIAWDANQQAKVVQLQLQHHMEGHQ